MKIIGLTGSIGMGKTTTTKMFEQHGVPAIGSDDIVHALYDNEAVEPIESLFPGSTKDGKVNRAALSKYVIGNSDAFAKLEALVHPLVKLKQDEFVEVARQKGHDLVLLDIPLLFEIGAEERFNAIIVVTCDADVQRQRVLSRKNMTTEKFEAILAKQIPDHEKRRRADHIVDTSVSLEETEAQVIAIINILRHS
ncbi:dephospho-CoA kinase [Lentilitoribacter sp. EG35]|uniref:dephospho-CoA kinase n=1 Tax=Lentilitoribacter sp. EG35 TaxID=3234192 RepID=UPI00345FA732